ncbi:MAG: hypothetical protein JJE18_04055 [Eubacteriaceae bacterium]|nr:hypothetical protein [Eubacteriaceae bacterium]
MKKLDELNDSDLKKKLASSEEDLEDNENEKKFIFKQSGMHVSSAKVAQQMAEYNDESLRLQKCIKQITEEIKHRNL